MRLAALLIGALASSCASAAAAPAEVLATVRNALVAEGSDIPTQGTLDKVITTLSAAEKSCSADASGQAVLRLVSEARTGYETLKRLSATTYAPGDMEKLKKNVEKATKKQKKANEFDADDTFLESKAEKQEREARVAKATAAFEAAQAALSDAERTLNMRKPRTTLLPSLLSLTTAASSSLQAAGSKAKVQVLKREPAVVVVDDWLGTQGQAALKALPASLANLTAKGPAPALPRNASDLSAKAQYDVDGNEPSLCVALDADSGVPSAAHMTSIEAAMAAERKLRDKGDEHCGATAALVDEAPEGWDAEEDGDFVGDFSKVADRYKTGCGPLTSALDAALPGADALFLTTSTLAEADILDASISAALGFDADVEALGGEILQGLVARLDATAVQPDDWDAEEDGPWEAPMLDASDATDLLAAIIKRGGGDAAALGDAYTFSSSPEVVTYVARPKGQGQPPNIGEGMRHVCADFSREKTAADAPHPAIGAVLFLGDAKKGGGDVTFPALGVQVAPKAGRLLLYETVLPDGSCDPASAVATAPLASGSSANLTVLRKTYYTNRAFSRETHNHEGPSRLGPKVTCDDGSKPGGTGGCRRRGHIGAPKGDAVLPLRGLAETRSCLAPMAYGPCDKPADYVPPPPPPKKAKPAKAASAAAQAAAAKPAEPPPPSSPPQGPRAPPPIQR